MKLFRVVEDFVLVSQYYILFGNDFSRCDVGLTKMLRVRMFAYWKYMYIDVYLASKQGRLRFQWGILDCWRVTKADHLENCVCVALFWWRWFGCVVFWKRQHEKKIAPQSLLILRFPISYCYAFRLWGIWSPKTIPQSLVERYLEDEGFGFMILKLIVMKLWSLRNHALRKRGDHSGVDWWDWTRNMNKITDT